MRGDKRGQEMSLNTIILIVIGIIVLVVLIAGFWMGWGNFRDKLLGLFIPSGGVNVDDIKTQCSTACGINSISGYCLTSKKLIVAKDTPEISGTCKDFATDPAIALYGFEACASLDCPVILDNLAAAKEKCSSGGADSTALLDTTMINYKDVDGTILSKTCKDIK